MQLFKKSFFKKSFFKKNVLGTRDNITHLPPSESILDNITNGFFMLDRNWIITYTNINMARYVKKELEDLIGLNIWEVFPEAIGTKFYINYHKAMEERVSVTFEEYYEPTKEWLEVRVIPSEEGIIGYVINITERKKYEETLEHIAYHDNLTSLPNRSFFEEHMKKMLENNKNTGHTIAMLHLDIDRFKCINDTLGHDIGEQLLKQFSYRLTESMDDSAFVARLGGDEFGVLLDMPKNEEEKINEISQQIINRIEDSAFNIENYQLFITISLGVSLSPQHGQDLQSLMKNADIALYAAKEKGKNRFQIYKLELDIFTFKRFSIQQDLKNAIEKNELELHYQPKVRVKTGEISSAEALIRWNHPEWGLLTPADIIPIAEETGLIYSLSNWVGNRVCQQIKQWEKEGIRPIPLSINIFADHFISSDFITNIKKNLSVSQLDGKWLEIEITETSLLDNNDLVKKTINELKNLGVSIALDDFGTGYSSLSYLMQYNVDVLKIDKSFITNITTSHKNASIVKTMIYLARGLGMKIVAEGVETIDQLNFLRQQECDEIQGYIFSKPVPENVLRELINKKILKPQSNKIIRSENQRKYYRIKFLFPLSSQMTILKINTKEISIGKTEVLIEDIGLGGIRFLTHLQLSISPAIILGFEVEISGEQLNVSGSIVWKDEVEEGIYQYGLEFNIQEKEQNYLSKMLNQVSLKMKKNPLVPNCNYVQTNKFDYIRNIIN